MQDNTHDRHSIHVFHRNFFQPPNSNTRERSQGNKHKQENRVNRCLKPLEIHTVLRVEHIRLPDVFDTQNSLNQAVQTALKYHIIVSNTTITCFYCIYTTIPSSNNANG